MFSKLAYAMITNGRKSYVSQLISIIDFRKWEIKLCISVNIYCRLPKLGMSIHVFKITLYYDNRWEIKLCISKLAYAMIKNGK